MVMELRYEGGDGEVFRTDRYSRRDEEHARKALADWEENKAKVLASGATYIKNWTGRIETREVTETPWERFET